MDLTVTDPEDLAWIRPQGYAVSRGEREPDAFSVTAPIRDATNRVITSITLAGPNFRLTDEQLAVNIPAVVASARET